MSRYFEVKVKAGAFKFKMPSYRKVFGMLSKLNNISEMKMEDQFDIMSDVLKQCWAGDVQLSDEDAIDTLQDMNCDMEDVVALFKGIMAEITVRMSVSEAADNEKKAS